MNYTREIAGEVVIVPVGELAQKFNGMVTLSETGQFLWRELIKGAVTKEHLIDLLTQEYDCSFEQAKTDVESFIEKLLTEELIQNNN